MQTNTPQNRFILSEMIHKIVRVGVRVFNATYNNISVISFIFWQSVLLVEETRVPGENHRPAESY